MLADATTVVRRELMAHQDFARLMLDTLKASLSQLEGQRAEGSAAEAIGATPKPGVAPGCGELLQPADRHVFELATVAHRQCIHSENASCHCRQPAI